MNYFLSIPSSGNGNFFQMITRNVSGIRRVQKDLEKALGKLDKAVHGTFQALSSTLEHGDAYTAGHQQRVAGLARAIALEMGLDEERLQGLYFAGLIHDLGKMSIPAEFLIKPTRLTNVEFALIKEHARIGYNILKDIEFPFPEHVPELNISRGRVCSPPKVLLRTPITKTPRDRPIHVSIEAKQYKLPLQLHISSQHTCCKIICLFDANILANSGGYKLYPGHGQE